MDDRPTFHGLDAQEYVELSWPLVERLTPEQLRTLGLFLCRLADAKGDHDEQGS